MKWAVIVVRSLMGLLFLFASITFFFKLITPPPPTGAMKTFSEGLAASVYLMPTVKVVELLCGLAFLTGRFVPLATVLAAPLILNFVGVHLFLAPEGLPVAILHPLSNAFLAWQHRESYKPLLRM